MWFPDHVSFSMIRGLALARLEAKHNGCAFKLFNAQLAVDYPAYTMLICQH